MIVQELTCKAESLRSSGSESDYSIQSIMENDELEEWLYDTLNNFNSRPFLQHVTLLLSRTVCTRALREILNFLSPYSSENKSCSPGNEQHNQAAGSISDTWSMNTSTQSSSSSSKRARAKIGPSEGQDEDGDQSKGPRVQENKGLLLDVYVAYYACPFYRHCAERHQRRACRQQPPTFKTIHRAK